MVHLEEAATPNTMAKLERFVLVRWQCWQVFGSPSRRDPNFRYLNARCLVYSHRIAPDVFGEPQIKVHGAITDVRHPVPASVALEGSDQCCVIL